MDQLEAVRGLVQDKCRHFEFEVFELAKVYEDDHFVNAFLEDNSGDMEKTAAAILKALVYRKKYQVYNIKTTDLPTEMFAWNARVGSDIYGKRVIWNNLGCYRNLFELVDVLIMLDFIHCRELFESHEKFDVYVDLRCISFKSIDTRMNRKYSSMLTTCFPSMLDHMYICGLPGSMTFIIQGMVKILPDRYVDKISFVTLDEAKARVRFLRQVTQPNGSNIRQVLQGQNVPEARIDKLLETFTSARRMSDRLFEQLGM